MAPPFEYQRWQSPYTNSIASLMERQGEIPALAAERVGNAQAAGILGAGQAWAGAAQNVGQAVSGAIQQAVDPRRQEEILKLQETRKAISEHDTFKKILKETPPLDENGMKLYDLGSLAAKATQAGIDPSAYLEHYANVNTGFRNEYQARLATVQAGARGLMLAPDAELAQDFLKRLEENHTIAPAVRSHLSGLLDADPSPANVIRIATPFSGQKTVMGAPGATPVSDVTGQLVGPTLPERPRPYTINGQRFSGDGTPIGEPVPPQAPRTPPSVEEQLLEAVAKGDAAKVAQIKETIRIKADAAKDPAQVQLANELANLRKADAQARLDALREKNAPLDVSSSVTTTMSGRKYLDLGEFQTPEAREKARKAAEGAGAMPVNKDVADGLRAADTARTNFQTIWAQLSPYLPKDAKGRLIGGPKNTLEKVFQANPVLGAYGSWRTAAIQAVQALAEKGMGLRLSRAEIDLMLQNDIPQLTDDALTAKQRIDNMMTLLESKERNALTRDRSAGQDLYYDAQGKKQ